MNKSRSFIPLLALCAFLMGLDSLIVAPLIPAMSQSAGFTASSGGLLISSYSLLYGLSAPFFGPLSDHWGRKRMIAAGLLLFGMGTVLTGIGGSLTQLLWFRGLAGLGGAMLMPSLYAHLSDTTTYESRGKVMGIVMGAMTASIMIGVPLGTFFSQWIPWRKIFYLIGLLALLTLLYVMVQFPKHPFRLGSQPSLSATYRNLVGSIFTSRSVFFGLFCSFLWSAGMQGMFAYLGVFYQTYFHTSQGTLGIIYLIASIGNFAANLIGGRMADRKGKKTVVTWAIILSSLGVLLFSLMKDHFIAAIMINTCWSAAVGFGQASLYALISELNPKARGTILSWNSSAVYGGMTAATALTAFILTKGTFTVVGFVCAVLTILILPILQFLVVENKPQASQMPAEIQ